MYTDLKDYLLKFKPKTFLKVVSKNNICDKILKSFNYVEHFYLKHFQNQD